MISDDFYEVSVETEHSNSQIKDPVGKEFEYLDTFFTYENACEYAERISSASYCEGKFILVRKIKMKLKYPPTFIRMTYFLNGKVYRYS